MKIFKNLLGGLLLLLVTGTTGFAQIASGPYKITASHSSKVIDVPNATANDNVQLQQYESNGSNAQQWIIESLGNSQYSIKTAINNKALTLQNGNASNGTAIILLAYTGTNNQKWAITQTSSGIYKVLNAQTGKAIDVANVSVSNGGLIHQWDYLGGSNQQWKFDLLSSGSGTQNLGQPSSLGSNNITNTSVNLTWWSVGGATKYKVYQNGNYIGTTGNSWTNYNATGLTAATTYSFTVQALDDSGNFGPQSSVHSVTTTGNTGGSNNSCMAIGTNLGGDFQWTSDGVDLRVFKSDVTNWSTETNPWNPAFLTDISGTNYKMFRFMDWGSINWSRETTWSDRTLKSENHTNYAQWFGRPIAYEWMVDLCNRTNKNMWINIPHRADDNYVTQLATLLKNSLNSGLNIYIEYSNETWNYTFQSKTDNGGMNGQLNYVQSQGAALNLPGAPKDYQGQSFYVYRSLQIFKIFNDVFGSSSNRLRKVLAYSGNEDVARQSLNIIDNNTYNPNGIKPDIFAVAPYVGDNGIINTGNASADFRSKVDGSVANGGYTQKFKSVVDAYNTAHPSNKMTFSIYEAGQHYSQGGFNQKNFSDNPNAYSDYMYMLNAFKPYYNTFMQFVHAAKCDENDCWGSKAYYAQTDAPKYNALKDFMASNNCSSAKMSETSENILDSKPSNILIYPNPAENSVTISSIEKITPSSAIITNKMGIVVKLITFVGKIEVNVADLPAGLYFVKVTGSVNLDSKLIIEKF